MDRRCGAPAVEPAPVTRRRGARLRAGLPDGAGGRCVYHLLPQEQVVRRLTTDRTAPDNQVPLVYDPSATRYARPLRDVGPAQSGRPDRRLVPAPDGVAEEHGINT
ncbi:MAG: hypothetical protein R2854_09065 [Caldilineaceae bacterium]